MSENSNHDRCGRFVKGNSASSGRKADRLKQAMLQAVSISDIKAIISTLVEAAKGGDVRAATLLFDRLLGRPHVNKEPEQQPKPMEYDDGGGEVVFDDNGETTDNPIEFDLDGFEQRQRERYEKDVNARAEQLLAERAKQGA